MAEGLLIELNGAPRPMAPHASVLDLVQSLGLPPATVAVEINRELVPRRLWDTRQLAEGDRIELVTLVGGG